MKKTILPSALLFLLFPFLLEGRAKAGGEPAPLQRLDLNGPWEFHMAGQEKWLPAVVPGCVHTDLLAAGRIPDPFFRTNERDLQWIDKVDWEYRKNFQAGEELLSRDRVRLVFHGLDTYADVFLNGNLVIAADNMFRTWSADCLPFLRKGTNTILVRFRSPVSEDLPKREDLGYQLPPTGWTRIGGLGDKGISMFARKAPYHYGWDWGPRFVTSGIWRPVYLEAWGPARIESVQYVQKSFTRRKALLSAVVEVRGTGPGKALLSVKVKGRDLPAFSREIDLARGTGLYRLDLEIPNPKLWWTNGLGEPHLYTLETRLEMEGKRLDSRTTRIGLRTLRLVRRKSMGGKSFYFELNGVPLYSKGADWIPADSFPSRVTPGKYKFLIESAAKANMNMLRVWGGGIYEDDLFYDLCDRYGILVWQDFMFACSMYPGDAPFVENVKAEAVQNVKRLRNHPCLALWCGNNEMDTFWNLGSWKKRYDEKTRKKIGADYDRLFHLVLPSVVSAFDPSRSYWPSSPLADWGVPASFAAKAGDYHYWGVWHGKAMFETFQDRVGRFMSEYGFQSFPLLEAVARYTVKEDWNIESEVMKAHQRSGIGNERIRWYMEKYYRVPKRFDHFLYMSQVLQAEGMRMGMEAYRRAKPFCMGSLYWQLDDCWPVASWSSIDYYGKWKALHYFAKKAYAPLLVSPFVKGGKILVHVVSDLPRPVKGTLRLEILDFRGKRLWAREIPVDLPPQASVSLFEAPKEELLAGKDPRKILLHAALVSEGKIQAENVFYFLKVKDLELPVPGVRVRVAPAQGGVRIRLKSPVLAKNVHLQLEKGEAFFEDDFFDLLPGRPVEIEAKTLLSPPAFRKRLRLLSVRDTLDGR